MILETENPQEVKSVYPGNLAKADPGRYLRRVHNIGFLVDGSKLIF